MGIPFIKPYAAVLTAVAEVMLQTGGNAGVIRDYGDGAANWHGTTDTFSDGPMEYIDWYQNPNVTQGTVTMSTYLEIALVN